MGNVVCCEKLVERAPEKISIMEMKCEAEEKKSDCEGLVSRCTGRKAGSRVGVVELILSGPKPGKFCYVNQSSARTPPAHDMTVTDFIEKFRKDEDSEVIPAQLRNRVKLCTKCDKVNAYTLQFCNCCCSDLSKVKIGYTDNVFTAFIFGIKDTRFPLIISLRYQDERLIVFDDLLCLTPCHLNCIYTEAYLPDLRCLFERPQKGFALLKDMYERAWSTAMKEYLSNKEFRQKIMPHSFNLSDEEIRSRVISGLNFPPSQFQLHLQFMLPPMMPFHYHMYLQGLHFSLERFFPVEYMLEALNSLKEPLVGAKNMPIEKIINIVNEMTGVNYYKYHSDCTTRYGRSHRELAAWDPDDFDRVIVNGEEICKASDLTPYHKQDLAAVKKEDTLGLQNYGRPFDQGRPTGTYYKYHKTAPLQNWLDMGD